MNAFTSPFRVLIFPFRSARALPAASSGAKVPPAVPAASSGAKVPPAVPAAARVRPAALLVLGAGLFLAAGMFVSYLSHDYPTAPEVLKIWVDTWGAFLMLPFLNIPPESYWLFMAVILIPLAFAMWMLMAGTAKLLSLLLGGRASYEQYLVITAFGFFPFWILAVIIDMIFSGVIDGYVLQALTGQFGPFAAAFWKNIPAFFYTILYGLGGVWIGMNTAWVETFKWWKAVLVALFTFGWPMLLMSVLMR